MINKKENPEMLRKHKAREAKELKKWEKERQKPKLKGYGLYILFLMMLIQCIDNIATTINTQMQSAIAVGLFQDRLSIMSLLSALSMPILILSIFYKALADRYGRKLLLCINTLGMGLGLLAVYLAGEIGNIGGAVTYILASAVIYFFIANDTQVLFIMETSDPKKRATNFSVINAVGLLSVVLIPMMRKAFMGSDITRWNHVYIVPSIVGLVICLLCIFSCRESDVFLESRIAYLKMTDEERRVAKEEKDKAQKAKNAQGGVGAAFRYAFNTPQLRWIFITVVVFGLGAFGLQYYEKIADVYYSTEDVTTLLMYYPFGAAAVTFINGFLSDKIGRKKAVVIMAALSFAGFALFYLGCSLQWMPVVAGLAVGLYCGASWGVTDACTIMAGESTPTNLRASMMSVSTITNMVSKLLAMLVPVITLLLTHDNYNVLGILCVVGVIPMLAVSLLILMFKVKDTAGTNLADL
ncbi:MAG: MFS transporter [Christensenellales bacterium]|jgi:MFS family permease